MLYSSYLISNVVYKFACSYDMNVTYVGTTTRHLSVRVGEHLHSKKNSAVLKHINVCQPCKDNKHLFDNFSILITCNTQFSTKIQEALLIKKHNPKLNTQSYANMVLLFCLFAHLCWRNAEVTIYKIIV